MRSQAEPGTEEELRGSRDAQRSTRNRMVATLRLVARFAPVAQQQIRQRTKRECSYRGCDLFPTADGEEEC